jgi:hypothetical protein
MGTIQRVAAFSWMIFLAMAATLNSASPLQMSVSPSVSRAPAVLTVRIMVNAGPEDRALHVVAESPSYYRASEVQLEGTRSEAMNVFEFRDLPTGLYQVTGVLVDGHGPRATISRLAKVEPGFGSR